MIWSLFILALWADPVPTLPSWEFETMVLRDINGMESPTALIRIAGRWYAGADLDEGFSGVYSLNRKGPAFDAKLLKYLPQMDIEDLAFNPELKQIRVVSARRFSVEPEDWVGQFLELEPSQMRLAEVAVLDVPSLCFDESMRCGLVAAMPINDKVWVALKKRDPSTLYLFEKRGAQWYQRASATLTYQRRFITVTAMRRWGSSLIFLVKDRWLLGTLPLVELTGEIQGELRLTKLFEFKAITQNLRSANREIASEGMAESFDIDEAGNLLVVLNNRGTTFLSHAGVKPTSKPKIAVFKPKKPKIKGSHEN